MSASQQTQQSDPEPVAAEAEDRPQVLHAAQLSAPHGLRRSVGLDRPTSVQASLWQCAFSGVKTDTDSRFVTFSHHLAGRDIWAEEQPERAFKTGTATIHPWQEASTWHSDGEATFSHVYLPTSLVSEVAANLYEAEFDLSDLNQLANARDPVMMRTLAAAEAGLFCEPPPCSLVLDAWGMILAEMLLRRYSFHAAKQTPDTFGKLSPRGIDRVIDYVEAHLDADLTLRALADVASMSVYHFARRFKETVGISPHAYVMARRVERARDMLTYSNEPLARVADACGFSSQVHFTTAFRKHAGVAPGQFRKQAGARPKASHFEIVRPQN